MSFDDVRPILTGALAALVALAIGRVMAKLLPDTVSGKSAEALLRENRVPIQIAHGMFVAGFVAVIVMYRGLGFADNDWRPLGIGFGFAFSAPLAGVLVAALATGRSAREALAAYSLSQRMPLLLMYAVSAMGVFALTTSIASLIQQK